MTVLGVDDVVRIASAADLRTYDPYDIWKTRPGFHCKDFYNTHPALGLLPVGALTLFDLFVNDRIRLFYTRQEYPIVRALAVLCLLNLHAMLRRGQQLLENALAHLDWLVAHAAETGSGMGWGLGFKYAVQRGLVYSPETAFSTMTPYVLEALDDYTRIANDDRFVPSIHRVFRFFDEDLVLMGSTDRWIATSYTNMRDRVVTNAISYTMYSYARLLPYAEVNRHESLNARIRKLYNFLVDHQRPDGSWFYSPVGPSFIDCFHTCIVLKNILKTVTRLPQPGADDIVKRGYAYLKNEFLDPRTGLYRRFSIRNKPSVIAFDLYDNAEMLALAVDMRDFDEANRIALKIDERFIDAGTIWSKLSSIGTRHNPNTLRWAVMPYLHALTKLWSTGPGMEF